MTITNIINDQAMTLIQSVNGICFFEESWMSSGMRESLDSFSVAEVFDGTAGQEAE